jgi:hypothetical protein
MKLGILAITVLLLSAVSTSPVTAALSDAPASSRFAPALHSESLVRLTAELEATQVIGETLEGDRCIVPVIGGVG